MKFISVFLLLGAVTAQNANNCNPSPKMRNGRDFILVEQPDNPNVAPLGDHFSSTGQRVRVADVFADGNHKLVNKGSGRKGWEDTPNFDDQHTTKWIPQGITSTADALGAGTYEGVNGWLVSWHRDDGWFLVSWPS